MNLEITDDDVQKEKKNDLENSLIKHKLKSRKVILLVIAVVLVLVTGMGVYNSPRNRISRHLNLGKKYLIQQNYEAAIVAFNKVIEIDERCLEAYVGGMEAYLNTEDVDGTITLFEQARTIAGGLKGEALSNNIEYIEAIYLYAERVYMKEKNKIAEILEEGLLITDSQSIKEALTRTYIEQADTYTVSGMYKEALEIYDRLLEFSLENEEVLSKLSSCLKTYLDLLVSRGDFRQVRLLIEKYKKYSLDVDFSAILSGIEEMERIEADNIAFMQKIYTAMESEDYTSLFELDQTEELQKFLERIDEQYIYVPDADTSLSGIGVGLYKFAEEQYYFYFGDYIEGIRSGDGIELYYSNTQGGQYEVYSGKWKEDKPNGQGTLTRYRGNMTQIINGNYANGFCNGSMKITTYLDNIEFDMSAVIEMGVPVENKRAEFQAAHPNVTLNMPDDVILYAYDNKGGQIYFEIIRPNQKMCVFGFSG